MPDPIKQPKNAEIKAENAKVTLAWKETFGKDRTSSFSYAQKFIDSECIRLMVPYTPARNNILYKSPTLGTKIGSGRIYYLNPYARYQYYGKLMVSSLTGSAYATHGEKKVLTDKNLTYDTTRHPQATSFWFEHMKAEKKEVILRGAAKIAGGMPQK